MPTPLQQIRPALLAAGAALLFYFSGFFVFWTPLPLFYLALKYDRVTWRLGFLLCAFLTVLFYLWLIPERIEEASLARVRFFGLGYLCFYLACAFFLSLGFWKRRPWVAWGWHGALGVAGLIFLAGFFLQGFGLVDVLGFLHAVVAESQKILDQMAARPEVSRELIIQVGVWLAFLPKLLPALLFVFALIVMALNIGVLKFFRRTAGPLQYLGPFQKLQIPHGCVWAPIVSGILFFLNEYLFALEALKILALNVLLSSLFVYFLQGLSILGFFMRRFSPLFRLGIYGLVLLFLQVMGWALIGVGVADAWVDFRKRFGPRAQDS